MRCDAKRLAEIEARHKAAIPGPWTSLFGGDSMGTGAIAIYGENYRDLGWANSGGPEITFMTNARQDVPDLLADLREARNHSENLEIRLMEVERARLLAVERAERAEATLIRRVQTSARNP